MNCHSKLHECRELIQMSNSLTFAYLQSVIIHSLYLLIGKQQQTRFSEKKINSDGGLRQYRIISIQIDELHIPLNIGKRKWFVRRNYVSTNHLKVETIRIETNRNYHSIHRPHIRRTVHGRPMISVPMHNHGHWKVMPNYWNSCKTYQKCV